MQFFAGELKSKIGQLQCVQLLLTACGCLLACRLSMACYAQLILRRLHLCNLLIFGLCVHCIHACTQSMAYYSMQLYAICICFAYVHLAHTCTYAVNTHAIS